MSGGHFDYQEYRLNDFADSIEQEISSALAPRPEKVPYSYISIYKLASDGSGCKRYVSHPELPSVRAGIQWIEEYERAKLKPTDQNNVYANCYGDLYEIKENVAMRYADGNDYTEWNEQTVQHMKEAVDLLRRAAIYVTRIDYLLSGDDGEETFDKRLQQELSAYEKNKDAIND